MAAPDEPTRRRGTRRALRILLLALVGVVATGSLAAYRSYVGLVRPDRPPESATGLREVAPRTFTGSVVVAAHPEATRVGRDVLAAGGTALDATVAVQVALGLVEPQSSGIGGGAFLLYWDADRRELHAFDGREAAPRSVGADHWLAEDGRPMRFDRAMIGGRSVGAPGVVRMLEGAHRSHGRLPWPRLFDDAIRLADEGFDVTPRLHELVRYDPILPTVPSMRAYFLDPDGAPWPVGHRLANPAYAEVLRALQREGSDALHRGPIAEDIVAAVRDAAQPSTSLLVANALLHGLGMAGRGRAAEPAPGLLGLDDLARYRSRERPPLCRPYRDHRVCGVGPPTSGGVAVLQILGFLERFDPAELGGPLATPSIHLLAEAQRLAYLDRARWIGDVDVVPVPVEGLLDPGYLRERGRVLDPDRAFAGIGPGTPPGADPTWSAAPSPEQPGTSHVSIVDAEGNVSAMTTSIEMAFGAHVMVRGFLLNNQLTDFSFAPRQEGRLVANAPGPGKRPRSSMSPLIIFDRVTNEPRFVLGSPGGRNIIAYVARTAVALMDWELSPQEAVALPHVVARGETVELESIGWPDEAHRDRVRRELEAMGHRVKLSVHTSGLHVVELRDGGLLAGIDPRREGEALGAGPRP